MKPFPMRLVALASAALVSSMACAQTAESSETLAPVTVTGEKIVRPLSETLSSVSVSTKADLEEKGDRSLADVLTRTPGVYSTPGNENWGIRGVPVSGFDDQGPATLNGAISVYVDGVAQPNRALTLSPLPLWDVEHVEIFRGAQSTTQGRNSLAGAVVVQTRNPTFKPSASAQVSAGNHGERGIAAAVGGPILGNVLAGRISLELQEGDGYIHNPVLNRDADPRRNVNLRGKLLAVPSDNTQVLLTLAHARNRQGVNSVDQVNDRPVFFSLSTNTPESDRLEQDSAAVQVDHQINDAWALTSITSLTQSTYTSLLDFDENPTDLMEVRRRHKAKLANQELRLGYQAGTLRGHVGVYLGRARNSFDDRLDVEGAPFGAVEGQAKVSNRAVFGELDWRFAPRWQLTAGLRHDRERNETDVSRDDFSEPGGATRTFHATLPKFGLSYELAPQQRLGYTVQRGYRSGGVNVRAGAAHTAYDPEFTTTHEIAWRASFDEQRLRLNANLYHTDWKDQQVSLLDATGNFFEVRNAARSRMRGLEASADYDVTKSWRATLGYAYNDARYRNFVLPGGDDLSGQAFLYAPRSMWLAGARYRAGAVTVSADVVWRQGSPSEYKFDSAGRVSGVRSGDDHAVVNLSAEYRINPRTTLSAYVKNLLNERYIVNNRSGSTVDVGAPRRLGVALRYEM